MSDNDNNLSTRQFSIGEIKNAKEIWKNEIYRNDTLREGFNPEDSQENLDNSWDLNKLNSLTIPFDALENISSRDFKKGRYYNKKEVITKRDNNYEITHVFISKKNFSAEGDIQYHLNKKDMVIIGMSEVNYAGKILINNNKFKTVENAINEILKKVNIEDQEKNGLTETSLKKYFETIQGDGETREFYINHNLESKKVIVQVDGETGTVTTHIWKKDENTVKLSFDIPLDKEDIYEVVIIG